MLPPNRLRPFQAADLTHWRQWCKKTLVHPRGPRIQRSLFLARRWDLEAEELARQTRQAVESILENERLTADLDDAAAQALLEWGVACAKRIAQSSVGRTAFGSEETMSLRLRATRRMMRQVNRWIAEGEPLEAARSAALLSQISEQAAVAYGASFASPDRHRKEAFLRLHAELAEDPVLLIATLRALFERSEERSVAEPAANLGQESTLIARGKDDDQDKYLPR